MTDCNKQGNLSIRAKVLVQVGELISNEGNF